MATESNTMVPGSGAVDLAVRGFLDELVSHVRDALGDHCQAILLGGSLARAQGMAWSQDGQTSLLSDIDVYVLRKGARAATEATLTRELRESAASRPQVECNLDLAFVSDDELRARAGTLHLQQLFHGHRVLFAVPEFRVGSCLRTAPIQQDEAQRLLLNRVCERVTAVGASPSQVAILDLKLLIDAPLAVLASYGGYDASRRRQREKLSAALSTASPPAVQRLDAGLRLGAKWRERALGASLDEETLTFWRGRAAVILPAFVSACLRTSLMASWSGSDEAAMVSAWDRACHRGDWAGEDAGLLRRWQRRGGRTATLRRARQWAPLAPVPVRPWWWHGWWGSGADAVHAAGVQRWAQDPDWRRPLQPVLAEWPPESDSDPDRWFGRLWADWILGKGRR